MNIVPTTKYFFTPPHNHIIIVESLIFRVPNNEGQLQIIFSLKQGTTLN